MACNIFDLAEPIQMSSLEDGGKFFRPEKECLTSHPQLCFCFAQQRRSTEIRKSRFTNRVDRQCGSESPRRRRGTQSISNASAFRGVRVSNQEPYGYGSKFVNQFN